MENGSTTLRDFDKYSVSVTQIENLDYLAFSSETPGFYMNDVKELKEVYMLDPKHYPVISAILTIEAERQLISVSFPNTDTKNIVSYDLIKELDVAISRTYQMFLSMSDEDKAKNGDVIPFIFAKKYYYSNNELFAYQKDNFSKIKLLFPDEFKKKFCAFNLDNALSISNINQGIIFSVNGSVYTASKHFLSDFFFLLTISVLDNITDDFDSKLDYLFMGVTNDLSEEVLYQLPSFEGFYFLSQYLLNLFTPKFPDIMTSVSEHSIKDRFNKFQDLIPLIPSITLASFPYVQQMYKYKSLLGVASKKSKEVRKSLPLLSLLLKDKVYLRNILTDADVADGFPLKLYFNSDLTVHSYSGGVCLKPEDVESCCAAIYRTHITFIFRLKDKPANKMDNERTIEIEIKKLLNSTDIETVTVFLNTVDDDD